MKQILLSLPFYIWWHSSPETLRNCPNYEQNDKAQICILVIRTLHGLLLSQTSRFTDIYSHVCTIRPYMAISNTWKQNDIHGKNVVHRIYIYICSNNLQTSSPEKPLGKNWSYIKEDKKIFKLIKNRLIPVFLTWALIHLSCHALYVIFIQ